MTCCRVLCALALMMSTALLSCGDLDVPETGTVRLGLLSERPEGFFRLRILSTAPQANLSGATMFDTQCVEARSQVYELSGVRAGSGYWVVVEAFASASCDPASRTEYGYRGNVDIPTNGPIPSYHVSLFATEGSSAWPEGLNISASLAEPIDICTSDADCAATFTDAHQCYEGQKPAYWCLPGCAVNADCVGYHPNARCDDINGWCMLHSPFPLNLSEPRAMGHAVGLENGAVAFVGGFGSASPAGDGGLLLQPVDSVVEVFDPVFGVFDRRAFAGAQAVGLASVAQLDGQRVLMAGGALSAELRLQQDMESRAVELTARELSSDVVLFDFAAGSSTVGRLDTPVARAAAIALDPERVLLVGGVYEDGSPSNEIVLCEIANGVPNCGLAGILTTPRVAPALSCLDEGCVAVMVLGGNEDGAVAERIDAPRGGEVATVAYVAPGLPAMIDAPQLCGAHLIGGASEPGMPGGIQASTLTVDGQSLSLAGLGGAGSLGLALWPATVRLSDGSCVVAGGLADSGVRRAITRIVEQTVVPKDDTLVRPRFAALTSIIGAGPFTGSVIFAGGLSVDDNGNLDLVRGAEMLQP